MALRLPSLRRVVRWVPALCFTLAVLAVAGCAPDGYPQTTLAPKADFAELLDQVFRRSFQLATIVFFLVEGVLIWALFRFRGKPGDAEPAQTHGNAMLEVVWTVIPAVILVFIAIPTIQTIFKTAEVPTDNPLVIEVTGHQWWWEFRYPEYNLVTAGDMHVPTGRTVDLRMTTGDVVHSFWTPQLAGKRDVFPGRDNRLWFRTETAGRLPGPVRGVLRHAARPDGLPGGGAGLRRLRGLARGARGGQRAGGRAGARRLRGRPVGGPARGAGPAALLPRRPASGATPSPRSGPRRWSGPTWPGSAAGPPSPPGWLPNTDENLARWLKNPQAVKVGGAHAQPRAHR